jgi:hypothetical protein
MTHSELSLHPVSARMSTVLSEQISCFFQHECELGHCAQLEELLKSMIYHDPLIHQHLLPSATMTFCVNLWLELFVEVGFMQPVTLGNLFIDIWTFTRTGFLALTRLLSAILC